MTVKLVKERKPKPDGRIVVNVSFTESEYYLLNHADEHGNFSQYVKKLIKADKEQQEKQAQPDAMTVLLGLIQNGQLNLNTGLQQQPEAPKEQKADKDKVLGALNKLKGQGK